MKRYRAQEGITPLTSHVMDTEAEPFTKPLASTRTFKDAEDIAAALNHHQGAVARAETAERLVALYREYGSPDLTRLVEGEAKRLDRIGGQS
jgi:hypothetical protein